MFTSLSSRPSRLRLEGRRNPWPDRAPRRVCGRGRDPDLEGSASPVRVPSKLLAEHHEPSRMRGPESRRIAARFRSPRETNAAPPLRTVRELQPGFRARSKIGGCSLRCHPRLLAFGSKATGPGLGLATTPLPRCPPGICQRSGGCGSSRSGGPSHAVGTLITARLRSPPQTSVAPLLARGFGALARSSRLGARDGDVNFVIIPAFSPSARK
jgi:hypothetical protein